MTTSGYNEFIKAVGVKILKAKLSEYIRLVKSGETVLVTERDEVVAELRPAHRQPLAPANLEEGLAALAERGEATLRSDEQMGWTGSSARGTLEGVSSQDLLDALRDEAR